MMPALPDYESARLDALASYDILDSLPEEDYDAITRIASQLCGMPISTITLLDDHRQWFKSTVGLTSRQTPRAYAFCTHTIQTPDQIMVVPDARADNRFADNPLTTGDPYVIFYAGVPLVDEGGYALGTLCVIDNKPNKLTDQQATSLKALARQVVTLLQLRRSRILLQEANQKLEILNADLQANNRILQAVVDNCPAGLVLWQAVREAGQIVDFRYEFTNPINASITGRSVEQMVGNTVVNLFPGVLTNGVFDRLVAALAAGRPHQYEEHYQLDQVNMWGNFSIVPLTDDTLLFTYQDISRLKETEDQLRGHTENLERLVAERTEEISQLSVLQNAILEHAGLAIVSTDVQGVIKTVNPAALHLFGYREDELIGQKDATFLYDPVELETQAQVLGTRLGRPVQVGFDLFTLMLSNQSYECTIISKDGRRIPTLLVSTTLLDKADTVIGYLVMATDTTALKTTRAELQKRNQELNTFFEVALDLHCIATTDGKILKTNRAWQTTLGYTAEELAMMNHFDLLHPNDREPTQAVITAIPSEYTNIRHINRFRRKDGVYRVIEWNVVTVGQLLYASARDITERQQAERQLIKLNQRLQLASRAGGLGVWEYNLQEDVLTWDEQMYAIHGLDAHPLPLRLHDYQQLIHPDDLDGFLLRRSNSAPNATFTNERRIIRPDGTIRYTELHGVRTTDKTNRPTGSVGVVRDITERKEAELALLRSGERYRSLVDNLKEVVFQTNPEGKLTFLNPFWTTMTGYAIDEALGQPFYAYISPDDQYKSQVLYQEFVAHRKTAVRAVVRYRHKSGKDCWAEIFGQVLTDDAGQPIGTTGTITDITERKQALDALRRSEQRFRDIAENISEVFWIHAAAPFQLLYINPAYERITGLSADHLTTNPTAYLDRVPTDDWPALKAALADYRQGREATVQFRLHDSGGLLRWFIIRTFVKKNHAGVPLSYIGVASDITSQKEKELVLQQSLAREQELNRLKSQFVSTASHEFRTPLATIQSSVDLIKLYVDQPAAAAQPAIHRHLSIIEKEILNFSSLLTDILTFGKIEEGKITFAPRWLDIVELVNTLISTHFNERTDGRTVQVSVDGAPRQAYVDEKLMSHALVNLLSNAFKFSAENPGLHVAFEETTLIIVVSDTGIGIPADELTHLFGTFFRARNAVNIQGSGLGLVITRQFIEQHGGQLTIQSQESKGTSCTITLPGAVESGLNHEPLVPI